MIVYLYLIVGLIFGIYYFNKWYGKKYNQLKENGEVEDGMVCIQTILMGLIWPLLIIKDIHNRLNKKDENTDIKTQTSKPLFQRVIRVLDSNSLNYTFVGFLHWNSESTSNPEIIEKIFEHLRTASVIRLYITNCSIEYTAETKKHGQVSGSCRRGNYGFFEFGLRRSGHRFDIYGEDRNHPTIKAFYEWWKNLVSPYEEEFNKDHNL